MWDKMDLMREMMEDMMVQVLPALCVTLERMNLPLRSRFCR